MDRWQYELYKIKILAKHREAKRKNKQPTETEHHKFCLECGIEIQHARNTHCCSNECRVKWQKRTGAEHRGKG